MSGLSIGPGFQQWISDHQATPKGNEVDISAEQTGVIVGISVDGQDQNVWLIYNKPTNEVIPFVQADL